MASSCARAESQAQDFEVAVCPSDLLSGSYSGLVKKRRSRHFLVGMCVPARSVFYRSLWWRNGSPETAV